MATNQAPTLDSLQSLLATVQRNERSLKRFQDIELALMGAPDFGEFLEVVLNRLRHDFDLSGVRLMLAEVDDTLRDLIDTAEGIRALDAGLCIAQDAGTFAAVCGDGQLWIGAPRERILTELDTWLQSELAGAALALAVQVEDQPFHWHGDGGAATLLDAALRADPELSRAQCVSRTCGIASV